MRPVEYLHKALVELREKVEVGVYPAYGICSTVLTRVSRMVIDDERAGRTVPSCARQRADEILNTAMVTWPEFSGFPEYPVRGNYRLCDPEHMWERGDYAAARRRLLDYCINVTERML